MAKHASGVKNYRVAGWVWAVLIAVVLITALIIAWVVASEGNKETVNAQECAEGDYELSLWVAPEASEDLDKIIESYNSAERIVADHCVTASSNVLDDEEALGQLKTRVPAAWVPADAASVIPKAEDQDVRVADKQVTVLGEPARPILRLSAGAKIDEIAQRSASDFVEYSQQEEKLEQKPLAELRAAEPAKGAGKEEEAKAKAQEKRPADVLFLLETSDAMATQDGDATRMQYAQRALPEAFASVNERGGVVSLWNYSSQLSPGARTPYRANVDFAHGDDGSVSQGVLEQLGTGGANYRNASIAAAYDAAAEFSLGREDKSNQVKVIVITTGDNDDDFATADLIQQLKREDAGVALSIIGIDAQGSAAELKEIAEATGGEYVPIANGSELGEAVQRIA